MGSDRASSAVAPLLTNVGRGLSRVPPWLPWRGSAPERLIDAIQAKVSKAHFTGKGDEEQVMTQLMEFKEKYESTIKKHKVSMVKYHLLKMKRDTPTFTRSLMTSGV